LRGSNVPSGAIRVASGPSLGENLATVKTSDTLNRDLLDATSSRHDAAPGAPHAATASDGSVLVVDDSRFVRASLVRGLAGRFRIQQAESGERAWELLLLDGSIAAILSDLSMPGIDGFELLRRVRASMLERVRELPFAMLSGSDDAAQRDRALALGADRFVVKGVGVGELADWLAERLRSDRDLAERARAETAASGDSHLDPPAPVTAGPTAAPPAKSLAAPAKPAPAAAVALSVVAPSDVPALVWAPVAAAPAATKVEAAARVNSAATVRAESPAPAAPAEPPAPPAVTRLVPDSLPRWFAAASVAAGRAGASPEASPSLIRMHSPGLGDMPARLRRGVRAADALFVESVDTAWLCVPASAATALRLAMRFGLLAAGRQAAASGMAAARVSMCLHPVDPPRPGEALAALLAAAPEPAAAGGLTVRAFAGAWGPAWQCTLPWPAVRLLAT
jgi:CheY-like chemotaxis protein